MRTSSSKLVLGGVEQIGAHARRTAGVVHEGVDACRAARRPARRAGRGRRRAPRPPGCTQRRRPAPQPASTSARPLRAGCRRAPAPTRPVPARGTRQGRCLGCRRSRGRPAKFGGGRLLSRRGVEILVCQRTALHPGGPKNVRYGSPARQPPDVQRGLARVVVAPLARFPARGPRARRHVVPAVRPVIDGVQQQPSCAGSAGRYGPPDRTACPACAGPPARTRHRPSPRAARTRREPQQALRARSRRRSCPPAHDR